MSTPRAKTTTTVDVKLRKALAKIVKLEQDLSQASMGVLNMRQMYEGAVQEKMGLEAHVARMSTMLTGVLQQTRGKSVTLKKKTLERSGDYVGVQADVDGDDLVLMLVTRKERDEEVA